MSWQGPPQAHQPVTSRLSANAAPREGGSPPPGHPSNTKTSPGAGSDQYPHCGSFRGKRKALFESSLRSGRGPEGLAPFRAGVRGSSEDTAASPPGRSGSWCGGSPVSPPSLLCFPLSPPPWPQGTSFPSQTSGGSHLSLPPGTPGPPGWSPCPVQWRLVWPRPGEPSPSGGSSLHFFCSKPTRDAPATGIFLTSDTAL